MSEVVPAWWVRSCRRCGRHPLSFINCDEWQCPYLGARAAIEGPDDDDVNSDPDAELGDPEDDTIGHPGDEMADWPLEGEEEDEEE